MSTQSKIINFENLLINKENILPLEFLLEREGKKLKKLQKIKQEGKLDFGKKVKRRDLSSLFMEVKSEVDSFLDVAKTDAPKFDYFRLLSFTQQSAHILATYSSGAFITLLGYYGFSKGFVIVPFINLLLGTCVTIRGNNLHKSYSQPSYSYSTKSITLKKEKKANLISSIAHEYTHHVQKKNLETMISTSLALKEGHARGVQRDISQKYREREDNESFLYEITECTFGELKSAYSWICKMLDVSSQKSLLNIKTSRDKAEESYRFLKREPTPHAVGNTLFYLYETFKGKRIYKDTLNGTFKLPRSLHWKYFI